MDKSYEERVKDIRTRLKNNNPITPEDIEFLLSELSQLELKLIDADILALTTDIAVQKGVIGSRSLIADARLDYGEPWKYEHAIRERLLGYLARKGDIERINIFFEREQKGE